MHCDADFAEDGSVIAEPGSGTSSGSAGTAGSGDGSSAGTGPTGTAGSTEFGGSSGSGTGWGSASSDITSSDDVDYGTAGGLSDEPDVGQTSSIEADSTASADADSVERTTLLLRGPVCVIMGLPAGIMVVIAVGLAFADLPGGLTGLSFLVGWIGVTGYLLRKPLASDAIGDGFYVYAGLLLVLPIVLGIGMFVRALLGFSDDTIGEAVGLTLAFEFFFVFPAVFFLLLGYGANYYAKQKIEAALDQRGGAA